MAVMRVLTNEIYVGTLIQGKESTPNYKVKVREKKPREEWIRIENAHEAIISGADFEIISDIIQKDTRVTAGKRAVSIYSGYLVCADCGCSMVRKKHIAVLLNMYIMSALEIRRTKIHVAVIESVKMP